MKEKEVYVEITRNGKLVTVAAYEMRRDACGVAYWARYTGIQSKQRKRILDWAAKQAEAVSKAVHLFYL